MGRLMAKLLKPTSASIKLCGRNIGKVRRAANRMGLRYGRMGEVGDADIIVLSVPFEEVLNVFRSISREIRHDALIIDISSVKTSLVDQLSALIGNGMEYLSLHPLFGPSTRKFKDQRMLAVEIKEGTRSRAMKEYLKDLGLLLTVTTVVEHDKMLAVSQVLHHFSLLSLSEVLADYPLPEEFAPKSFYETVKRLRRMSRNWRTIIEIQKRNPYAGGMRKIYADTVTQLLSMDHLTVEAVIKSLKKLEQPRTH